MAVDIGAVEHAAPIIVSTTVDESDGNYAAGDLSLREALVLAAVLAGTDTVRFADSLFVHGATGITLTYDGADSGTLPDVLTVGSSVVIEGPSAQHLAVRGNNLTGVFQVNSGVTATIRDLSITGGSAGTGGGIMTSGTLTLERVSVDHSTGGAGGGIYVGGGTLSVSKSTIANNSASFGGGGIFIVGGQVVIDSSTISTNTVISGSGGGVYLAGGTLQLVQSTVTQNRGVGGGLKLITANQATVKNSIIAENFNGGGSAPDDISGTLNVGASSYNLLGSGGSGGLADGVNGNIVLAAGQSADMPLGEYGGTTKTHALYSYSRAIDSGNEALVVPGATDQRGLERSVAAFIGLNPHVDIGAFEYLASLTVTTLVDENDGNFALSDLSLREALIVAAATPNFDSSNVGETINFAPSLFAAGPATLSVAYTGDDFFIDPMVIGGTVFINGPGMDILTIDGQYETGLFHVEAGNFATFRDLRMTAGYADPNGGLIAGYGGAIYAAGGVVLERTKLDNNIASYGGAVYTTATGGVSIISSEVIFNQSLIGGAVFADGGGVTVDSSDVSNNRAILLVAPSRDPTACRFRIARCILIMVEERGARYTSSRVGHQ